jgi:hypothetical protein
MAQPSAKRLERVRLAGAFGVFHAPESGSKLPHSKRFALGCIIPGKLDIAFVLRPSLLKQGFLATQGGSRRSRCP